MSKQLVAFLIAGGVGTFFFIFGVLVRSGKSKAWFLQRSYPGIAPRAIVFAAIPIGIAFLFTAIIVLLPEKEMRGTAFLYGAMPIYFIGLFLAMWQPKWLLPKWYQWLLENHSDIVPLLEEEARVMNRWDWENHIKTQEGLEKWVVKVKELHRLSAPITRSYVDKSPEPGDKVTWYKLPRLTEAEWPIEATVLEVTDKRVKIKFVEQGQIQIRYVKPEKLRVKRVSQ